VKKLIEENSGDN